MNIGHGIRDYVSERESMTVTDSVATSTSTSSILPFSQRNLMAGKKLFGQSDNTSVSSDHKLRPKVVQPLTSRKSRIQRQATPFREMNLLKASRELGKFRKRNPTNLGTGFIHGNSHIEENEEHGEVASAVIVPESNSIVRVSDPQSQHGEPSYSSLDSPSLKRNPALFKRKEPHSPIIGVLREEKALPSDSDSDCVTLERWHSRAVNKRPQSRNKNSLFSNLGTLASAKVEDVNPVPSYNYKSKHQHMKNLKPICSDTV